MNRTSGGFRWLYCGAAVMLQLCRLYVSVSEPNKPLSPQGCFRCSQSHQAELKVSGFNLEHRGLNWVYGAKPSVQERNSVVRFDWPFLGIFKLSACCPKGQTSPMVGIIIINIIIIVNTIVIIIISVIEAWYGAGVWLKVTWYGLDHHLQSPSTFAFSPSFTCSAALVLLWAFSNLIDGSTKQCQNMCKDDPWKLQRMHNDLVSLFFHLSSFPSCPVLSSPLSGLLLLGGY